MSVDREWISGELKSALRALAAAGPEALLLVPEGSVKADELALDFSNYLEAYLGNFGAEITHSQRQALVAVDDLLQAMSGHEHADLWTEEAVMTHPKWESVRCLARDALRALGWGA